MGCSASSEKNTTLNISHESSPSLTENDVKSIVHCLNENNATKAFLVNKSVVDKAALLTIAKAFRTVEFSPNEVICHKGDTAKYLYILKEGFVMKKLRARGTVLGRIEAPNVFGESHFFSGEKRQHTYVASSHCVVHLISNDKLKEIIDEITRRFTISDFPLFGKSSDDEINYLNLRAKKRYFKNGERIYSQGDTPQSLFLIANGQVKFTIDEADDDAGSKSKTITLSKDAIFGDRSLFLNVPEITNATAIGNVDLFVFDKHTVETSKAEAFLLLKEKALRTEEKISRRMSQSSETKNPDEPFGLFVKQLSVVIGL